MTAAPNAPHVYEVKGEHLAVDPDQPIETHFHRLNNILRGFWKHTHFYQDMNYEVPMCQIEGYDGENFVNEDGEIQFFYYAREGQQIVDDGTSYEYRIRPDGTVYCSTNEVLDLKAIDHLWAVVSTVIRDIYGEYDDQKAWRDYMNEVLGREEDS